MVLRRWPPWWDWDLELSSHLLKRMLDRRFTEVDLRTMLEHAQSIERGIVPGRWTVRARYRRRSWEIILEPDNDSRLIVVITAYPIDG